MSAALLWCWSTWPAGPTASAAAREAVTLGLAACTQVMPGARSCYRWEAETQEDDEVVVIFKTTQVQWEALRTWFESIHPWEVPCLLALPVLDATQPWQQWAARQTQPGAQD
jgi:periplasmic divalent cation tolerance protein